MMRDWQCLCIELWLNFFFKFFCGKHLHKKVDGAFSAV
jgi:hypothetical protein